MGRTSTRKRRTGTAGRMSAAADPFKRRDPSDVPPEMDSLVHIIRPGIRCDTEKRGHKTPRGKPPTKLVVEASEGFVPLWAKDTILRWRFRERSMLAFQNPEAAKEAIEELLAEAILKWEDAAPVKFSRQEDAWDFEIVMREADDCTPSGACVLASAFFPDAGQHELALYPMMFTQSRKEQIDTFIHEIGHVFGLRHFFALLDEAAWPAEVFGVHDKFSIMNYGEHSELSDDDKADLKSLYELAWAGALPDVGGTPVKFVKPFHTTGDAAGAVAVGSVHTLIASSGRR